MSQALQEGLAWARLTGKPRATSFPPNTSCSRAALALDALAASTQQAFDASGPVRKKKHAAAAAAPNAAAHMAAASAAFAVGRRADLLTHRERNSLLRQLHRDNAWLLRCLTDSNAAVEQLHDRLAAEQKVESCWLLLETKVPNIQPNSIDLSQLLLTYCFMCTSRLVAAHCCLLMAMQAGMLVQP